MRFTSAIAAALALALPAVAQTAGFAVMTAPTQDQEIPGGSAFDVIWTPGTPIGPVSITLLQGDTAATLQLGPALAAGLPSTLGKFTYAVPSTASFKTYGFKISLDSDPATFQYSFPFHIAASSASSSAVAVSLFVSASAVAASSESAIGSVTAAGVSSIQATGPASYAPVPTATIVNATTITATVCTKCHQPTSSGNVYSNSTAAEVPISAPYNNGTTLLSIVASATQTYPVATGVGASRVSSVAGASSGSPAAGGSTASGKPVISTNAAVAKAASAGFALLGLLTAFAL